MYAKFYMIHENPFSFNMFYFLQIPCNFFDSLIIVTGFLLLLVSDSSMSYLLFPGIIMMAIGGNWLFIATVQVGIDTKYTAKYRGNKDK